MHFLITAGGTREYIDPVRFISNASTGRMGYALANAAIGAGHEVTLVSGASTETEPEGVRVVRVVTADEMFDAVVRNLGGCDCLIMAAAVSDYAPAKQSKTKIKKSGKTLTLKLRPTIDIVKWAGEHKKKNQLVVGFALEDKGVRRRAEKKLKTKNLDMIIANTPAAIGADESSVQIKTVGGKWVKLTKMHKQMIARKVIALIEETADSV